MVKRDPKHSRTILFYGTETIRANENYPCKLSQIKGIIWKAGSAGMLFKKRWPWTDHFNYHLLRMKERGLMEQLYKVNMKKSSKSCPGEHTVNRVMKEPGPIGTDKTISLYVALLVGFLTSLMLLLIEKSFFR